MNRHRDRQGERSADGEESQRRMFENSSARAISAGVKTSNAEADVSWPPGIQVHGTRTPASTMKRHPASTAVTSAGLRAKESRLSTAALIVTTLPWLSRPAGAGTPANPW